MKILIIGLGSMGRRRIGLLKANYPHITLTGVDTRKERRSFCQKEYAMDTEEGLETALLNNEFEAAFVCTSPLSHSKIITECLKHGISVFTELNLVPDGYERNMELAREKGVLLFLSSTALYRKEMNYVIHQVRQQKTAPDYCYHIGQYLPDWHPWESYGDFFVGEKRTNGCREILAIELPWLQAAFGRVLHCKTMKRKSTGLHIPYEDSYKILFQHESGSQGCLSVDVVCREPVRKLEVYGEDFYLEWNGKPDTLFVKNLETGQMEPVVLYSKVEQKEGYSKTIIENQYLDEIKEFFQALEGKTAASYGFKEDMETLRLIDKIEE